MTGPKPATLAALKECEGMTRREAVDLTGYSLPTVIKYERLFGLTFVHGSPKRTPRNRALADLYHVYTHTLDGEVIYIGAGKGKRSYNMAGRSDVWKARVGNRKREVQVGIIASFKSKRDALNLENRLIWDVNPSCSQHQRVLEDSARDIAIRQKRASGMTLQAIGDQYSITRERVRQICEGRDYEATRRPYSRERYHVVKERQAEQAAA